MSSIPSEDSTRRGQRFAGVGMPGNSDADRIREWLWHKRIVVGRTEAKNHRADYDHDTHNQQGQH